MALDKTIEKIEYLRAVIAEYNNSKILIDHLANKEVADEGEEPEFTYTEFFIKIRLSLKSWCYISEENHLVDLFDAIIGRKDDGSSLNEQRLTWLVDGTANMLMHLGQQDLQEVANHCAVAASWISRSALLEETLVAGSGTQEFLQEVFVAAPWTLFFYLFQTTSLDKALPAAFER